MQISGVEVSSTLRGLIQLLRASEQPQETVVLTDDSRWGLGLGQLSVDGINPTILPSFDCLQSHGRLPLGSFSYFWKQGI